MAPFVYTLCSLAALACAVLLFVAWRRSQSRMLCWCAVCFSLLTLANVAVIVDHFMPHLALWPVRHGLSLAAMSALLYGLILEEA